MKEYKRKVELSLLKKDLEVVDCFFIPYSVARDFVRYNKQILGIIDLTTKTSTFSYKKVLNLCQMILLKDMLSQTQAVNGIANEELLKNTFVMFTNYIIFIGVDLS